MSDGLSQLGAALIDRYRLERELGQGGMATVYLAQDLRHDRKVALKVLRPELAAVLGAERFLHEIKTTANLQHPHILPLHDSGTVDGTVFYVMPFVQGESLRDRLNREKQLPIEDAIRLTREVASALDYAHRHGVIHRDIKPENILLHDGQALVADFGIALAASAAGGSRMTETGLSLGTPHYMSPEQALGQRELDARSDVYALGVVLYEMLVGDPPHTGSTPQAIIAKVLTDKPASIVSRRDRVSPALEDAVLTALEKLPADRFASVGAFAAALTTSATDSGSRRVPVRPRGARALAVVPWLIAAVGVATAFINARRDTGPRTATFATLEPPPGFQFAPHHSFGALSPDGQKFAFVTMDEEGNRQLWVRDISRPEGELLPGTTGAESPFWSPDGRALAYFAGGKLWRLDLNGSPPRILTDAPYPIAGTWGSRGDIVFGFGPFGGSQLAVGRADGSAWTVRKLVGLPAAQGWVPSFLPDGRQFLLASFYEEGAAHLGALDTETLRPVFPSITDLQVVAPNVLVYTRRNPGEGTYGLFAQRFDPGSVALRGQPVRIGMVYGGNDIPAYAASASTLLYLSEVGSVRSWLNALDVTAPGSIVDTMRLNGNFYTMRAAPRGPLVAFGGEPGLVLYDRVRKVSRGLRKGWKTYPVWNPDGSRIAAQVFNGTTLNSCEVMVLTVSSETDTTIVKRPDRCFFPSDWTADGKLLVLSSWPVTPEGRAEVWTYSFASGTLQPEIVGSANISAGAVSPDGRWIAYVSDESGGLQINLRPFQREGPAIRVSPRGGAHPRGSRAGRALYSAAADASIMRVSIRGAELPEIGTPERVVRPGGDTRLLHPAIGTLVVTPFDLTEDTDRFVTQFGYAPPPGAAMVLNWQSLLDQPEKAR